MSPIYRAEQARLSFHSEAGHGGYIDHVNTVLDAATWSAILNGAHAAGSRAITFDGAPGAGALAVGDYILISTVAASNAELRKVASLGSYDGTAATGTIYIDYPLGFYHPDDDVIDEKTIDATLAGDSFATFLPGVYETVTTPDLTPEFLPQYFLSTTADRNWSRMIRGRQTFNGSLPNFILLNGYALRFPIGAVRTTVPVGNVTADVIAIDNAVAGDVSSKGIRTIHVDGAGVANIVAGDYLIIARAGTNPEVREVISSTVDEPDYDVVLNYPLMFTQADDETVERITGTPVYTHTIVETSELDSLTWNLYMRDSTETAANDFTRRYVGGIVNRATLSADEGGLLRYSWDDVQFLDLVHNQLLMTGVTGEIAKSSGGLLTPDGIGGDIPNSGGTLGTPTYPTTEPYYFSQGDISIFGVTFARIRNFRLEVNNNLEARYYIRNQYADRIPYELQEQRREYRMTATIAMPDSIAAATATTRTLWKELILEGDYDAGLTGFNITLTFTRGASDTIVITLPASGAAADTLDGQGAFIIRAPHNIGGDSPVQADVEIMVRDLGIVITDSVGVYP